MLFGKIEEAQLYYDFPEWKSLEKAYQLRQEIIEQLKKKNEPLTVLVFLGTWCPDSEREVPHFLKIVKSANLDRHWKIELLAVDRKKQLDNDLPQKYAIEYVPTFVFLRQDKEIGRIVESPDSDLLEQDILQIISGKAQ